MDFIGAYWWLWLVVMVVFGAYALYNQLKRVKGIVNKGFSGDMGGALGSFQSGIGSFIVASVLTSGSGILLLLSIIINLIAHSSH